MVRVAGLEPARPKAFDFLTTIVFTTSIDQNAWSINRNLGLPSAYCLWSGLCLDHTSRIDNTSTMIPQLRNHLHTFYTHIRQPSKVVELCLLQILSVKSLHFLLSTELTTSIGILATWLFKCHNSVNAYKSLYFWFILELSSALT